MIPVFSIVKDSITSAGDLNHDLQLISRWALQWRMIFNSDLKKPAEEIIFYHKRTRQVHPSLFFNSFQVKHKIYDEVGWESLSDRKWFHRLVQFFKIQNGLNPG